MSFYCFALFLMHVINDLFFEPLLSNFQKSSNYAQLNSWYSNDLFFSSFTFHSIYRKKVRLNWSALFYTEKQNLMSLCCLHSLFNSILDQENTFMSSENNNSPRMHLSICKLSRDSGHWSVKVDRRRKHDCWLQLCLNMILTLKITDEIHVS